MIYTIKKGKEHCTQSPLFPKKLGSGITAIAFTVIFNESVLIDLGSTEANNAAQKLFGVSWGLDNHKNSWRLTYSIASIANKKLYIRNYMYEDYIRINTPFKEPDQKLAFKNGSARIDGIVTFDRPGNQILLTIPSINVDEVFEFDFTGVVQTAYQQFFYIEPPVPHDVTVEINQAYIR